MLRFGADPLDHVEIGGAEIQAGLKVREDDRRSIAASVGVIG